MTRFEATVFRSVLEKMALYSGYSNVDMYFSKNINIELKIKTNKDHFMFEIIVNLSNADPIDCSDCHLAWLIRDNRNLMSAVVNGDCSNRTRFDLLDPNGFIACPVSITVYAAAN